MSWVELRNKLSNFFPFWVSFSFIKVEVVVSTSCYQSPVGKKKKGERKRETLGTLILEFIQRMGNSKVVGLRIKLEHRGDAEQTEVRANI